MHERLDFLQGEVAIFISVHCPKDALVRRLKLLERDCPVTISIHQSEEHPHHHLMTHALGMHHAASAHHASSARHASSAHHASTAHHAPSAHHSASTHHPGMRVILIPLLLQDLWLLDHRTTGALLGSRWESATRQNEYRRHHCQNVLLHLQSPHRLGAPVPFNSALVTLSSAPGERPCRRRAAEQSYEFPPPHGAYPQGQDHGPRL